MLKSLFNSRRVSKARKRLVDSVNTKSIDLFVHLRCYVTSFTSCKDFRSEFYADSCCHRTKMCFSCSKFKKCEREYVYRPLVNICSNNGSSSKHMKVHTDYNSPASPIICNCTSTVHRIPLEIPLPVAIQFLLESLEAEHILKLDSILFDRNKIQKNEICYLRDNKLDNDNCVVISITEKCSMHCYHRSLSTKTSTLNEEKVGLEFCNNERDHLLKDNVESTEMDQEHCLICQIVHLWKSQRSEDQSMSFCIDPLLVIFKAWKFPELEVGEWLRRLPSCKSSKVSSSNRICINPNHWSRVISFGCERLKETVIEIQSDNNQDLFQVGAWTNYCSTDFNKISSRLNPPSDKKSGTDVEHKTCSPSPGQPSVPLQSSLHIGVDNNSTRLSVDEASVKTEYTFLDNCGNTPTQLSEASFCFSYGHNDTSSSTSTSLVLDEEELKFVAKKPRPFYPLFFNETHERKLVPKQSPTVWAHMSFWEAHRHIGQSWFKLSHRTFRVVYDQHLRTHNTDNAAIVSTMKHIPLSDGSTSIHCVCLSSLVSSPKHIGTSKKTDVTEKYLTGERRRRYLVSTTSKLKDASSSWRQCYRLGTQGILFTITSGGQLWLDNQCYASNMPIFASSPCFLSEDDLAHSEPPVIRIPAGCSILLFDTQYFLSLSLSNFQKKNVDNDDPSLLSSASSVSPVVQISLGKGWGPSYRRPDIAYCPARLELWMSITE